MKRAHHIILLIVSITFQVHGQSNEVLAKSSFVKAQEYFNQEKYNDAIDRLLETKKLLGTTYSGIESLLARSYYLINQPERASEALNSYFNIATEADPDYRKMLLLIDDIKELEKKIIAQRPEIEMWSSAITINTERSILNYLEKYPNGLFVKQAKAALQRIPPASITDPRDGKTYKTVRIGDQVWMAEDMALEVDKSSTTVYGKLYRWIDLVSLCPEGWRIPTLWDFVYLTQYYGAKYIFDQNGSLPHQRDAQGYTIINPIDFAPEAARALKSTEDWEIPGTNSSGFTARPSGFWNAGIKNVGETGGYWTSTPSGQKNLYFRFMVWKPMQISFKESHSLTRFSCRCIKE